MTQRLFAPWRMEFISKGPKIRGCVFCHLEKQGKCSAANLVLYRGKKAMVVLNKYPYTNGHLMVMPKRHVADLEKLTTAEHAEIHELLLKAIQVLKKTLKPHGLNMGLNLGRAAGAGVEGHLHYHLVPRWTGDSNFMPIIGGTKVMPELIEATYLKLAKKWS